MGQPWEARNMLMQLPRPTAKLAVRFLFYAIGLFILALGVAFSINSRLGVSPVSSLPYVASLITGLNLGLLVMASYLIYIMLQIILLGKKFRWIDLTQLLFSVLFGYFVDLTKVLLGDFRIPTYPGQLLMLGISMILISIGVVLYVNVNLINMPMEALTVAVRDRLFPKRTFSDVKIMLDTTVVTTAILLSFLFLKNVSGVREGTVLSALLVGRIMKVIHPIIVPRLRKICF